MMVAHSVRMDIKIIAKSARFVNTCASVFAIDALCPPDCFF